MGNCCKIVKSKEGETLRLAHTWGAMVGAVMRAVILHKSDNHSFRPFVQCGVSLLWLIFLPPRVFFFNSPIAFHKKSNSSKIQKIPTPSGTPYHKSSMLGYVHTIPDSFCADRKTIPDRASVHT